MNESTRRQQMMDYLYGELEADERRDFEQWLADNPEARAELDAMQETRMALSALPDVKPAPAVFAVESPAPRSLNLKRWKRAAIAAAFLGALWLFNFRVEIQKGGVILAFGKAPEAVQAVQPPAVTDNEQWRAAYAALQTEWERKWKSVDSLLETQSATWKKQQNVQLAGWKQLQEKELETARREFREKEVPRVAYMVQHMQLEQQEELRVMLEQFWSNWQNTRQTDLKNIGAHFSDLYQDVETRQKATEAMFVSLMGGSGVGK